MGDDLLRILLRHIKNDHLKFHPGAWGPAVGFAYRSGNAVTDAEARELRAMSSAGLYEVRTVGVRYYHPRQVVLTRAGVERLSVLDAEAKTRNQVSS